MCCSFVIADLIYLRREHTGVCVCVCILVPVFFLSIERAGFMGFLSKGKEIYCLIHHIKCALFTESIGTFPTSEISSMLQGPK